MEPNKNHTESPFSSQTNADQTNPFTGDLKGEFTSEFGTNTNAVSQIFNSNGFASQGRTKIIVAAVALLSLIGGGMFYIQSQDSEIGEEALLTEQEDAVEQEASEQEDIVEGPKAEGEEGTTDALQSESAQDAEDAIEASSTDTAATASNTGAESSTTSSAQTQSVSNNSPAGSSGSIQILSPSGGAEAIYDETNGPAEFSWDGSADRILFSRNSSMKPVYRYSNVSGTNSYKFHGVFPGTWFWQLEGPDGKSEVKQFNISSPVRRQFDIIEPQSGQSISSNGGSVSWSAAEKVARYQVQFKNGEGNWANPIYKFGTAGTKINVSGVSPGVYDMRVGAFSEVSGRWEWKAINGVSVQ